MTPSSSGARPRHHLDQALLEDEVERRRDAGGDDPRARAQRRLGGRATARRSGRASRRRRAPTRPCTCCPAPCAAGRARGSPLVARRCRRRRRREADVRDDDLAGVEAARRDHVPDLRRVERHRQRRLDGRALDPAGRGVHAGGDVDRDHGDAAPRSARRSPAAAGGRGAPRKPVPKSASTTTSAAAASSTNGTPASFARASISAASPAIRLLGPEQPHRALLARLAPARPRRRARRRRSRPVPHQTATRRASGKRRSTSSATRLAGALHQLERRPGIRGLGRSHLLRGVERLVAHPEGATTATAAAMPFECVIERSISPAPTRSRPRLDLAREPHARLRAGRRSRCPAR